MTMGETPPIFSLPLTPRELVLCHVSHISFSTEVVTVWEMIVVSSVQPKQTCSLREQCNTLI